MAGGGARKQPCVLFVLVSHRLVRGYVSDCPDGAPSFPRTGSINKILGCHPKQRAMAAAASGRMVATAARHGAVAAALHALLGAVPDD
eukprot:248573-Prymnesium_polylepis.1